MASKSAIFAKRRPGLFKKASELCTLCGVEIAIIAFSPANKVFCFGHPSVESIIERYLAAAEPPPSAAAPPSTSRVSQFVKEYRNATLKELNEQLSNMLGPLEAEKMRGEELTRLRKDCQGGARWWEAPIEELGLEDLQCLKKAMENLRKDVYTQKELLEIMEEEPAGHGAAKVGVDSFQPPVLGVEAQDSGGGDGGLVVGANVPPTGGGEQLSVNPWGGGGDGGQSSLGVAPDGSGGGDAGLVAQANVPAGGGGQLSVNSLGFICWKLNK